MEKAKIQSLAKPKTFNRSLPKLASVYRKISTISRNHR